MKPALLFIIILIISSTAFSHIVNIGPNRQFKTPSQAQAGIVNGDTVEIDSGDYIGDVAPWYNSNLLIRGVGGMAHFEANGNDCEGKAIWVIKGNNITVENIEFSGCAVPDNNGAGIRFEGDTLTLLHCYIHNNQDGILTGARPNNIIRIEFCEFADNGAGDGLSHGMYIGAIKEFYLLFNYIHGAKVGHNVKSRSRYNYIAYNRIMDEENGNSSYLIDLPNGGYSHIIGNSLMKGVNAENGWFISYGMEGIPDGYSKQIFVTNNTMVNRRSASHLIQFPEGTPNFLSNNLMVNVQKISEQHVDSASNLMLVSEAEAGFVDAQHFDYHLMATSPAINKGTEILNDKSLVRYPVYEYMHPADSTNRVIQNAIDIGAFEYNLPSSVEENVQPGQMTVNIFPNPVNTRSVISLVLTEDDIVDLSMYNILGDRLALIFKGKLNAGEYSFLLDNSLNTPNINTHYPVMFLRLISAGHGSRTLELINE